MARAPTTADVFNAIAEPRRRQIIDLLAGGMSGSDRSAKSSGAGALPGFGLGSFAALGGDGTKEFAVGDLVRALRIPQPAVSKHLRVLRRVRVVTAARRGRRRMYRLNPTELKPVHDWVHPFERFWDDHLAAIKAAAERAAKQIAAHHPAASNQTRSKEQTRGR